MLFRSHLFKVEELSIHGGSNRYWLNSIAVTNFTDSSVDRVTKFEVESGLFNEEEWGNYAFKVRRILNDFLTWLRFSGDNSKRVFGYGAAAKASTILNSIEVDPNLVIAIADVSLEKQQRFMPPSGIRIISPQELFTEKPTDVVIFPWNIKFEIAHYLRSNLGSEVRLWCAIPEMHEVKTQ